MPIMAFNKATDPTTPDDVRINTTAIRFVEAARPGQPSLTVIHVLGEKDAGIAVMEPFDVVVAAIGGLVSARRYYAAGQADDGRGGVCIAAANVSQRIASVSPSGLPTMKCRVSRPVRDGWDIGES